MKINSFISGCLATITVILGIVFFYHSCQRNNVENSSEKTNETVYDTIPILLTCQYRKTAWLFDIKQ